jgi:hypothetical protein
MRWSPRNFAFCEGLRTPAPPCAPHHLHGAGIRKPSQTRTLLLAPEKPGMFRSVGSISDFANFYRPENAWNSGELAKSAGSPAARRFGPIACLGF